MKISNQSEFVAQIAKRARFTRYDIKLVLETITGIFEELVSEADFEGDKVTNVLLRSRGFGMLYVQKLGERKGNKGQMLPESKRVVFKLSENIRRASPKDNVETNDYNDEDEDLTEFE